jgi:replicative DNA helicase
MRFFDDIIEKRILAYCVQSKESVSNMQQYSIKPYLYNQTHINFYIICSQYFKRYGALVTDEVLENFLISRNADEATVEEYKTLYAEIRAMQADLKTLPFFVDQLKNYSLKRNLYTILERGVTDLENLEATQVLENISKSISPLQQVTSGIPLVENFIYDTVDKRKESYLYRKNNRDLTKGLMLGFERIDGITNGIYQKELALFFGRTGSGKSRVLNNVAYNLAAQGEPGIMFSLEMYMDQLERIFDSRGASVSYKKLKKGSLTEDEETKYFEFLDFIKNKKPPLYLVDYSASCSPGFIQSIIREKKQHHSIKWVCIDYLTLMSPDEKWTSESGKYGMISRELKQVAKSENVAIITAGQSNRQSVKAKKAGTHHLSLSDQIAHDCDLIVHLSQSEDQEIQNILEMNIVKYRDGESKTRYEVVCDWDKNYVGDLPHVKKGAGKQCSSNKTVIPTADTFTPPPQDGENLF